MADNSTHLGLQPRSDTKPWPSPAVTLALVRTYVCTSLRNSGAGTDGGNLKADPRHPSTTPTLTPGGGGWKPSKMSHKKQMLRLHTGLPKAQGSLLTQIRTGKISLTVSLH